MKTDIRRRIRSNLAIGIVLTLLAVSFPHSVHAGILFEPFATKPAVAGGTNHSVALRSDGTVWSWGRGWFGQLGNGNSGSGVSSSIPVQAVNLNEVVSIAAGHEHTLALRRDGTVWAWGRNNAGQLGIGGTAVASSPVQVSTLTEVVAIAAGANHSLALQRDGTVWAWGNNIYGQLGYGTGNARSETPKQVIELADVKAIAAGSYHSLALKDDGTVWAWGHNYQGQLGYGTNVGITQPNVRPKTVDSANINDIVAVAGGGAHSVALRRDGTVWAWGDNSIGQLGIGSSSTTSGGYVPQQVLKGIGPTVPLTDAAAISAGSSYTLALLNDGTVWAWGANASGQLGDGTFVDKVIATKVERLLDAVAIGAGSEDYEPEHSLAVTKDGSVWSWGESYADKLGVPDEDSNIPLQVSNFSATNPLALSGRPHLTYAEWSTAPTKVEAVFTNNLGLPFPSLTLKLVPGPGLTEVDGNEVVSVPNVAAGANVLMEWRVRPTAEGTYPVRVEVYRTGDAAPFAAASYTIVAGPRAAGGDPDPAAYTVTFNSNGGSSVDVQRVNAGDRVRKPADPVRDGNSFAGWYSDSELTAEFDFTTTISGNVTLYAKWKDAPSYIPITIGGKEHERIVSYVVEEEEGRTTLTATADSAQLKEQLAKAGQRPAVVVPVEREADGVTLMLTGDAVKALENSGSVIAIRTKMGSYTLPAAEIHVGELAGQLGRQEQLSEVIVRVSLTKSDAAASKQLEQTAAVGGFRVVSPPVDFAITASYGGKTASADKFGSFVKRALPLTGGVKPNPIATAVVLEANGQVRHVPTYIVLQDGRYYAVFHSLTNSQYAVISQSVAFADVEGHWSKQAVNDLASRHVIRGVDRTHFLPDAPINRAAFAAIVVRALGLADIGTTSAFTDVKGGDWYIGAVAKAQEYRLVAGYEDNTFRPNGTITRQEAVAVMERALKLAGVGASMDDAEANAILSKFADAADVGAWAKHAFAASVKLQLVVGSASQLRPTAEITRAEAAVIVRRALETAKLIDSGKL